MSQPIADSSVQIAAALGTAGSTVAAIATDPSVYWLGVSRPVVLLAFAGSCCALSFMGSLGRWRAMTIVACCTLIGACIQPFLGWIANVPESVWPATGFISGLIAHVAGTALFGAAPGALKDALDALISRLRGRT